MYAKSIIEQVRARGVARKWSRHLVLAPVAMALAVATLPFTLNGPMFGDAQLLAEPLAVEQQPAPGAVLAENPFTGLVQASVLAAPKRSVMPLDAQQRAIVSHITRRFGVSVDVVTEFVRTAYAAGKRYGVDPLLVVAVMAVESSYNPIAESHAGAKGLMQIIPKYHLEKFAEFGGEQSVFDPRVNILVGTRILREYLLLHGGDLLSALQYYAGATADRDAVYTQRVLNQKDQLDALAGFPKTERRNGVVMQVAPERTDAISLPPVRITIPAPPPAAPVPVSAEPAAQPERSVPTQPQAALPAPVAATVAAATAEVVRF
ncbi:MAG: lytic transglycosylase domain-containing protein [Betaproteobacteria bacterium]|nr:lytic transglycosylase domain-containing protein [Betaproteobacteria bacterium]